MEGRNHNRRKSANGSKKRTTYEDLRGDTREEACEFLPVRKNAIGFVIGKKGNTINQIKEKSGAKISTKSDSGRTGFMIHGNEKQRACARGLINETVRAHDEKGGFKKLDVKIPEKFMGFVIGKGREKLNNIETKTGVALKVIDNSLYFTGSAEQEKKAIREIKDIVNRAMKRSQSAAPVARFVYVDTTQLEENHEFELCKTQSEQANSGEKYFKLKLLEHPLQEETSYDFADTDSLKEKILGVLKQIQKEKEEGAMIKVDMWCHFGDVYITRIDEDEEEETFTLKEIKDKIESADGKSWTPFFKEGVQRIEVEQIEKFLTSCASTDDIRYDFQFFTPSCRDIRVKAWLVEEQSEEEGATASSVVFSRSAPTCIPVKNVLTRILSEEETGDTSNTPCFHMCAQFHQRMKADILIPSKGFDCRLLIRTFPNAPKTPEAKEEDKLLESYLMNVNIDQGQLRLPPNSKLPHGFDLFYQRRSLRRTYQYEMDGEQFALTVCKDQAKGANTDQTDLCSFEETATKTDIHLHCEEWDQVLDEGNWEPEQIVAKLPTFLKFLRQVQRNVAPHEKASEDGF